LPDAVNGARIDPVVDTGASVVALTLDNRSAAARDEFFEAPQKLRDKEGTLTTD